MDSTFKKDKNGNVNISIDDLKKFNDAIIQGVQPSGSNFVTYDDKKFNSCKFRSAFPVQILQACCGGKTNTIEGYYCERLKIYNVRPFDCYECQKYESK